ncbi:hypothetical protein ABZ667_16160 [Streptomyces lavendulae]|uniref:hypothetical protein n=1 Tax=Streptomyces lavendulae TaxID=1914 RepID=UPI0033FB6F97
MAEALSGAVMTADILREKAKAERKDFESLDWDTWLMGDTWAAAQGEDFQCEPKAFAAEVRRRAREAEMACETEVKGDRVYFRFSHDLA